MFNRTIQVKMLKTKKETANNDLPPDILLEDKATIIGHHVERGIQKIGSAIVTYVIVDTIRQIVIGKALRS